MSPSGTSDQLINQECGIFIVDYYVYLILAIVFEYCVTFIKKRDKIKEMNLELEEERSSFREGQVAYWILEERRHA